MILISINHKSEIGRITKNNLDDVGRFGLNLISSLTLIK